ncbi:MAG: SDR family NAD(P)-dependent oxidoreductase [Thiotrichales bacterium]
MIADPIAHYAPPADLLRERVILVTGAADGIGAALALACARHGATVVLLDKSVAKLEAVYDAIVAAGAPQPAAYPMDLLGATVADYLALAETLRAQLGRLDGLVNNAGWIGALAPFEFWDAALYQKVMTVNLHAPFFLTQACLPLLREAPDPTLVYSSHASQRAYWGGFGVAKAGLLGLVDILAHEFDGERPVRVNAVDTGPVNSAMRRLNYPGEPRTLHPSPEAVVTPYLYLLGPDSRGTTGLHYGPPCA